MQAQIYYYYYSTHSAKLLILEGVCPFSKCCKFQFLFLSFLKPMQSISVPPTVLRIALIATCNTSLSLHALSSVLCKFLVDKW